MPGPGILELFLLAIASAVVVFPAWRICSRAGFPGPLGLLAVVPLANLALLYFLAFARWKGVREQP